MRSSEAINGITLSDYEVVIEPNQSWLKIAWRPVAEYRDLLFLLVRREFLAKYKQTVLGPLWFIIQPLLTTLVFTLVFNRIAQISTDEVPPMLFYLCGLLGWNYFAQNVSHTGTTFTTYWQLFGKVYFPRVIVPLSMVISNLLAYAIQFVTLMALYVIFMTSTPFTGQLRLELLLLLPFLLLHIAALSLGIGLWISALGAKYRDFVQVLPLTIQLWMFATPVIYPASEVPAKFSWLITWNPVAPIIEAHRAIFFGSPFDPFPYFISIALTIGVLLSGLMIFQKVERTFVDTV